MRHRKVNLLCNNIPHWCSGNISVFIVPSGCRIGEAVYVTLKMLETQASAGPFFTGLNHVVNHAVHVAKTHYTVLEHSHRLFSWLLFIGFTVLEATAV